MKNKFMVVITIAVLMLWSFLPTVFADTAGLPGTQAQQTEKGSNISSYVEEEKDEDIAEEKDSDADEDKDEDIAEEKDSDADEDKDEDIAEEKDSDADEDKDEDIAEEKDSDADEDKDEDIAEEKDSDADEDKDEDITEEKDSDADEDKDGIGNGINLQEEKEAKLEAEKDAIEKQKDDLEEQKDDLEELYEKAKESGNIELAQQLLEQTELVQQEIEAKKQQMKQIKDEMKAIVRSTYTDEELEQLEKLAEILKESIKDIKVMPIDSIIAEGKAIKFDTPPVIKEGRTLIPVRALSEGFGAVVDWNSREHKVTITKGETKIVLQIDSNIAYVNGVEVPIDVSPEVINNRTVVPLRFIIENLGLEVNWDTETETIEIQGGQSEATTTNAQ